jgi:hypothetical protein
MERSGGAGFDTFALARSQVDCQEAPLNQWGQMQLEGAL